MPSMMTTIATTAASMAASPSSIRARSSSVRDWERRTVRVSKCARPRIVVSGVFRSCRSWWRRLSGFRPWAWSSACMESLRGDGTSAPCGCLCKVWTALAGRSGVADHVVDRAHQRIQVHRLDEDAGGPIPLLVLHLVQQFRKGGGHQQRDIRRLRCGVEALHELPRLWLPDPDIHNQGIRVAHDDLGEDGRAEVTRRDPIALPFEELADDEQEVGRIVDDKDVLARPPAAVSHRSLPRCATTHARPRPIARTARTGRSICRLGSQEVVGGSSLLAISVAETW